ncbi:MAG: hypothetical protein AB7O56_01115 [Bauldia sp.]
MKPRSEIDRPFRSKAALEFERSLIAQYREIANPDLKSRSSDESDEASPAPASRETD